MSLISINDLSFYYDGSCDMIFEHVTFQIDTNWKLGLTGRNGRGKTTFLKLLLGEYEYRGSITADVQFDYFPYEITEKGRDTIEIIEETDPDYVLWKILRELSLLRVDADVLYRPFATLSNGEQTKVMLAVLFSRDHHFLLIDEPTNHLDMDTRQMVMEYLSRKKGFILVSHDQYFLDGCVEYILAINKTNIEVMRGNFSTWWEEKEQRDRHELLENEKLKKDIRRLTDASRRTERWSDAVEKTKKGTRNAGLRPDRGYIGHKAAKMMKRSLAMENRAHEALEDKKKLLKNLEEADTLKLEPLRHHKNRLVTIEEAGISCGSTQILEGFTLSLDQGERVVLQGPNGCGKSSIIRMILRVLEKEQGYAKGPGNGGPWEDQLQYCGKTELAGGLKVSWVSQDTSWLKGSLKEFAEENGMEETLFFALLRKLDFSRVQLEKRMEELSGGQKKKVLIARSLCERAHLYIWDEPLNFIDIFSRMQITELIQTHQPTMLLVEHDRRFIEEIATRVVELERKSKR